MYLDTLVAHCSDIFVCGPDSFIKTFVLESLRKERLIKKVREIKSQLPMPFPHEKQTRQLKTTLQPLSSLYIT